MQDNQEDRLFGEPREGHQQVAASPQTEPTQPAKPVEHQNNQPHKTSAVQIVWQLLTYALWAWALTALSILLAATLAYYIADKSGSGDYEFSLYALAALICLLPFAFVADKFYTKNEPEQKHGFSAVVLVLSAVIIFLTTLGGFITAVVTALSILVNPGDTSSKFVIIFTSLVVSLLGALLFVRILNPPKLQRFIRQFPLVVIGIVAISVIAASFGPFASEITARNDKLLEQHLPSLNNAIQDYAQANDALPKKLEDLDGQAQYDENAQLLVSKNLVEYKVIEGADDEPTQLDDLYLFNDSPSRNSIRDADAYELCVTYKRAKGTENQNYDGYDGVPELLQSSEYQAYLDTYYHKAGRVCYRLQAYIY